MKHVIILAFLFASFSYCKGQIPKTRKVSKGEVIYSSPYIGEPFPIDTARSASIQALLKMMHDSGITTMPFTSGIAISRWRDTTAPKYDTVKCIMLVCDTNNKYSFYKEATIKSGFQLDSNGAIVSDTTNKDFYECDYNVHWQYGYSVREWNSIYVTYLDAEKNKLPKNIIVWMAKEIYK